MKRLKENWPIIGGVLLFAICFSVVVTMSPKAKAKYYEHSDQGGSIALSVHVGVKDKDENLSNIGFKLSRVVNDKMQFALVEKTSNGCYRITGWVDKESQGTQIKTNNIGDVTFENLTQGVYTVYESEITNRGVNFVEPITIEVKKNLDGELITAIKTKNIQSTKTDTGVSIALEHELDDDWSKELKPGEYTPDGICISKAWHASKAVPGMKSGVEIIKETYPPGIDWEATLNVKAYYAYPDGARQIVDKGKEETRYDKKYYDLVDGRDKATLEEIEYKEYTLSSKSQEDGTIKLENTVDLWDCALEHDTGVVTVEIEEPEDSGYVVTFSSSLANAKQEGNKYTGELSSLYGNQVTIHVMNWDKNYGDLEVKKTVKDSDKKEEEFTFTVILTPEEGKTLEDKYFYTINGSEEKQILTLGAADANGVRTGTFKLKNNDTIRIIGLPAGTTYQVAEEKMSNYQAIATGEKGVIPQADIVRAEFTNENVPETLDNSNPILWVGTMILAVAVVGGSCYFLKRRSH